MAELKLPVAEESIRELKVGDFVELTGRMITGRDAAHKWLIEDYRENVAPYLKDTVIYHCGPVVAENEDGTYDFVAAGPTTSIREEPYQADVIGRYGLRGVIGKGGMGAKTLEGLGEHGAVYLHAVGGAAQVLARAIPRVEKVFMLSEFGVPEALWVIEVERFPVMVTMDSHGASLHDVVEEHSKAKLQELLGLSG
ncbi:MAG: fumarate hydratase C-terminal domain-containing protein [Acidobacteria bacterium]|jgi:fumarate hydratase subunit beta|nr:fumarate hydratase C-terminal domain-containing protein [Acidobacteriota bacterium]